MAKYLHRIINKNVDNSELFEEGDWKLTEMVVEREIF